MRILLIKKLGTAFCKSACHTNTTNSCLFRWQCNAHGLYDFKFSFIV